MNVQTGPAPPRRTRRQKIEKELRLLKRDGLVRYVSTLRALRRFHRSVRRADEAYTPPAKLTTGKKRSQAKRRRR
jgi:hypothetical protein